MLQNGLIICYRRIDCIPQLICKMAKSNYKKIFIAIDGPKSISDINLQLKLSEIAIGLCNDLKVEINIWQREINLGLAPSVISAIDWFFENVEYGSIFEDDLEISDDFFTFANGVEQLFIETDDVLVLSGSNLVNIVNPNSNIIFTNYPIIWGWVTDRKKWKIARDLILESSLGINIIRNRAVRNFWKTGARRSRLGKLDSWAVPLAEGMLRNGYKCLVPPVNLITNLGQDEFATHTNFKNNEIAIESIMLPREIGMSIDLGIKLLPHYNSVMEREHYKIRNKHIFSYILSYMFDTFRNQKNLGDLESRLYRIKL